MRRISLLVARSAVGDRRADDSLAILRPCLVLSRCRGMPEPFLMATLYDALVAPQVLGPPDLSDRQDSLTGGLASAARRYVMHCAMTRPSAPRWKMGAVTVNAKRTSSRQGWKTWRGSRLRQCWPSSLLVAGSTLSAGSDPRRPAPQHLGQASVPGLSTIVAQSRPVAAGHSPPQISARSPFV